MNTPTANIFDLLLGPIDPAAIGAIGDPANQMPPDNLFGDLLGQLLVTPLEGTACESARPRSPISCDVPTGFSLEHLLSEHASLAEQAPETGAFVGIDPDCQILTDQPGLTSEMNAKGGLTSPADSKVAACNRELQALLSQQSPIGNLSLQMALSGRPVDVPDGTYRIVNQQQTGTSLNLEIVGKDESQPIRISIPLAQMKAEADGSKLNRPLVSINAEGEDQHTIQQLLMKMNLRQLTVGRPTTDATTATREAVAELTIAAEDQSRRVNLVQRVPQPSLVGMVMPLRRETLRQSDTPVMSDNASELTAVTESGTRPATAGTDSMIGRQRQPEGPLVTGFKITMDGVTPKTLRPIPARFEGVANGSSATADNGSLKGEASMLDFSAAARGDQMTESATARPVSFHVPPDAAQHLKSSRHAIQIRIEPDHLGPARLSISASGDKIRAHVVVESAEAKVLVESRLEHLVRQLDKAHIKFDQIDVSVAGDNERHEFREPYPRRPLLKRLPQADNAGNETEVAAALAPAMASRQYISSHAVNMLA